VAGIWWRRTRNLDLGGLISRVYEASLSIDLGRKGFAVKGKADEGRVFYERGIAEALAGFKDAQATADPEAIILAEYTFLNQELQFCEKADADALGSLAQAIAAFDDAFRALGIVGDRVLYQGAERTHPRDRKYRVDGFPKDAFHVACIAHRTRVRNIMRAPGIDPIEKALLRQRRLNLAAAQNGYAAKQKKAMT